MYTDRRVVEKFRGRIAARYQQMIARTGAGDIEQVALRVIHFLQSAASPTVSMRSCKGMTAAQVHPLYLVENTPRLKPRYGLAPSKPATIRPIDAPHRTAGRSIERFEGSVARFS